MTTAKKTRDSNIELLRIVAMLLVLIVHTNFLTNGFPTNADALAEPVKTFSRYFVQSVAIVCVNLFIMISGWFGIKPKLSRFLEFMFQILFFMVVLYVVFHFISPQKWPIVGGLRAALNMSSGSWFVTSYVFLYLLSPVLNAYTERANSRQFLWLLICFFLLQSILGWAYKFVLWFDRGYSATSFIGLYLLAQYVRRHSDALKRLSLWQDLSIWLLIVLVNTALAFICLKATGSDDMRFYFYNSPIVIAATLFLFLAFTKIKLKSAIVNWMAVSAFAAFLLHMSTPFMEDVFAPVCRSAYAAYPYPMYLLTALAFVVAIFTVAILLDKVRIAVWRLILRGAERVRKK